MLLFFITFVAHASEKMSVCAKYRTEAGWSKNYQVEATIIKGTELIRTTGSLDYNSLATYVVIFWDKDQASFIELSWPFLTVMGQEGTDRRGVKWEITKSHICF